MPYTLLKVAILKCVHCTSKIVMRIINPRDKARHSYSTQATNLFSSVSFHMVACTCGSIVAGCSQERVCMLKQSTLLSRKCVWKCRGELWHVPRIHRWWCNWMKKYGLLRRMQAICCADRFTIDSIEMCRGDSGTLAAAQYFTQPVPVCSHPIGGGI